MTEISFYFNVPSRTGYACRLLRRAQRQGMALTVTGPVDALNEIDRELWTFAGPEFLAHGWIERAGEVPASLHATTDLAGREPDRGAAARCAAQPGQRDTAGVRDLRARLRGRVDRRRRSPGGARALEGVRPARLPDQAARGGGMSTGRPPPGTIPTLTEVVAWPGAGAGRGTAGRDAAARRACAGADRGPVAAPARHRTGSCPRRRVGTGRGAGAGRRGTGATPAPLRHRRRRPPDPRRSHRARVESAAPPTAPEPTAALASRRDHAARPAAPAPSSVPTASACNARSASGNGGTRCRWLRPGAAAPAVPAAANRFRAGR